MFLRKGSKKVIKYSDKTGWPGDIFPRHFASAWVLQNTVYVFGGLGQHDKYFGDIMALGQDMRSWHQLAIRNTPSSRHSHSAVSFKNQVYVFGGLTLNSTKSDDYLYVYSSESNAWTAHQLSTGVALARFGHSAAVVDGQMYIFAGRAMNGLYLNDMFSVDLENPRNFTFVPQTQQPAVRMGHTACVYRGTMIIFGGHNSFECFSDVWMYHPKARNWAKIICSGTAPSPRTYHSASVVGSTMFIFGGKNSDGVTLSDLFAFDLKTFRWFKWDGPSPPGRYGHCTTMVQDKLFIVGGFSNEEESTSSSAVFVLDGGKMQINPPSPSDRQPFDIEDFKRLAALLPPANPPMVPPPSAEAMSSFSLSPSPPSSSSASSRQMVKEQRVQQGRPMSLMPTSLMPSEPYRQEHEEDDLPVLRAKTPEQTGIRNVPRPLSAMPAVHTTQALMQPKPHYPLTASLQHTAIQRNNTMPNSLTQSEAAVNSKPRVIEPQPKENPFAVNITTQKGFKTSMSNSTHSSSRSMSMVSSSPYKNDVSSTPRASLFLPAEYHEAAIENVANGRSNSEDIKAETSNHLEMNAFSLRPDLGSSSDELNSSFIEDPSKLTRKASFGSQIEESYNTLMQLSHFHVTNPDPERSITPESPGSPMYLSLPEEIEDPSTTSTHFSMVSEASKNATASNEKKPKFKPMKPTDILAQSLKAKDTNFLAVPIVSSIHTEPPKKVVSSSSLENKSDISSTSVYKSPTSQDISRYEAEVAKLRSSLENTRYMSQSKMAESQTKIEELRRRIIVMVDESEYLKVKMNLLLKHASVDDILQHDQERITSLENNNSFLIEKNKGLLGQLQNANSSIAKEHKLRLLAESSVKDNDQQLQKFDEGWKFVLQKLTNSVDQVSDRMREYQKIIDSVSLQVNQCRHLETMEPKDLQEILKPLLVVDEHLFDFKSLLSSLSDSLHSLFEFRDQWSANQSAATKLAMEHVEQEKQMAILHFTIVSLARKVNEKEDENMRLRAELKGTERLLLEDLQIQEASRKQLIERSDDPITNTSNRDFNESRKSSLSSNPAQEPLDMPALVNVSDTLKLEIQTIVDQVSEMRRAYKKWTTNSSDSFNAESFFSKLDQQVQNLQITYALFSEEMEQKASGEHSPSSIAPVEDDYAMSQYMTKIVTSLKEDIAGIKVLLETTGNDLISSLKTRKEESDILEEMKSIMEEHLREANITHFEENDGFNSIIANFKLCLSLSSQKRKVEEAEEVEAKQESIRERNISAPSKLLLPSSMSFFQTVSPLSISDEYAHFLPPSTQKEVHGISEAHDFDSYSPEDDEEYDEIEVEGDREDGYEQDHELYESHESDDEVEENAIRPGRLSFEHLDTHHEEPSPDYLKSFQDIEIRLASPQRDFTSQDDDDVFESRLMRDELDIINEEEEVEEDEESEDEPPLPPPKVPRKNGTLSIFLRNNIMD